MNLNDEYINDVEIERIKYEIGSKEMEIKGLKNRLKDMRHQLIINSCVLLGILLFFYFTIWKDTNNVVSEAFVIVLSPIYYILLILYIIKFIMIPTYELFINSNLEIAKKIALRKNIKTISGRIYASQMELLKLENELNKKDLIFINQSK